MRAAEARMKARRPSVDMHTSTGTMHVCDGCRPRSWILPYSPHRIRRPDFLCGTKAEGRYPDDSGAELSCYYMRAVVFPHTSKPLEYWMSFYAIECPFSD